MPSFSGKDAINFSGIVIRAGSVQDIDTLSEIDVDAAALFAQAGLPPDFPHKREFAAAEHDRWLECLAADAVLVAAGPSGRDVGFAVLGKLDGEPYLAQLSVRLAAMRRGIGTKLLNAAGSKARGGGGRALWLITYSHLTWNRPFYERRGFVSVALDKCGSQITDELFYQRRWLPLGEQRVVMRKDLTHHEFAAPHRAASGWGDVTSRPNPNNGGDDTPPPGPAQ